MTAEMIPILYKQSEAAFADNGIGRLAGCRSCTVTEQRNGSYELTLTYPASGPRAFDLKTGRIVYATHDYTGTPEPFRIYSISKATGGLITVRARHIAYDLASVIVRPNGTDIVIGLDTAQEFLDYLSPHIIGTHRFSFVSDVQQHYYAAKDWLAVPQAPISMWELLGGSSGDTLQGQFAGEFKYEKWTVKYLVQRGQDRGVKFRRGRSYSSLEVESNVADLVIGVIPYWVGTDLDTGDDITVMSNASNPIIYYGDASAHPGGKIIPLDCSSIFDEAPTVADIEAAADEYIERDSMSGRDAAIYKVNLVKDTADSRWNELQGVALCDLVWIEDEVLGIGTGDVRVAEEVTELTYDTLAERTVSVTLGVNDKRITEALKFPSTRERVGKIIIEDMVSARTGQHTAGTTATAKTNSAKVKALEKKVKEPATASLRGAVKPGRGLSVDADGTLNADGGGSSKPDWCRVRFIANGSGVGQAQGEQILTRTDVWTDGIRLFTYDRYVLHPMTDARLANRFVYDASVISAYGDSVWTHEGHIYYSNGSTQLEWDPDTLSWVSKSWSGLSNFTGDNVWSDGVNVFYSEGNYANKQFVLNGTNWEAKTWTGLVKPYGKNVWSDGAHIYYSAGAEQYVLANSAQGRWETKTWTGISTTALSRLFGDRVWTDGSHIYFGTHEDSSDQTIDDAHTYMLVMPETGQVASEWTTKQWSIEGGNGETDLQIDGRDVWRYNGHTYARIFNGEGDNEAHMYVLA